MKRYLSVLLFLLGIFALGFFAFTLLRNGTEFARNVALTDCTNQVTVTHFHTQRGRDFVLAFASFSKPPATYPVHIHFVDIVSKKDANFEMGGDYSIPLDTSSFLRPQSDYEMTVTFAPNTRPSVAISLQWVQFGRDRGK
jgi:hypothetical protein